ncbi:MAG: glutathione peroxidase [Waltera sp.]
MNIYDFSVDKINGEFTSLREYEGKVILIVNSATRCGFTPQYDELEDLYEAYVEDGFVILEFCQTEFGQQAPESNQEIAAFCDAKFGIHFPHFAKVLVNGEYANPLFKYFYRMSRDSVDSTRNTRLQPCWRVSLKGKTPITKTNRISNGILQNSWWIVPAKA